MLIITPAGLFLVLLQLAAIAAALLGRLPAWAFARQTQSEQTATAESTVDQRRQEPAAWGPCLMRRDDEQNQVYPPSWRDHEKARQRAEVQRRLDAGVPPQQLTRENDWFGPNLPIETFRIVRIGSRLVGLRKDTDDGGSDGEAQ